MKILRLGLYLCLVVVGSKWSSARGDTLQSDQDYLRRVNRAFVEIARKVSASVVVINVVQKPVSMDIDNNPDEDQFGSIPPGALKEYHEQLRRRPMEKPVGQGSGIIIREDGYILTNGHVVEDSETISVRLQDGTTYQGTLRGVDAQSDVAVIKIDAKGLPAASLGDSARTEVGEFVVAIGAPFRLDFSVTFGHVSAKSRGNIIEGFEGGNIMDQDFIQTDALINPGNSGGPLVNVEGQVIGINTLIQGLHTGIGFAIPSNLAGEISAQLIEKGRFSRPYLGIAMRSIRDESELRDLVQGVKDGVVVKAIVPDGPAAKSSLKPTDIITGIDGEAVATPQQLRGLIRGKKIGVPVTMQVFRQGKTIPIQVSLAEWPESAAEVTKVKNSPAEKPVATELGITVKPLTPALAAQFGISSTDGVLIASVDKNSPAARVNLKPGDVVTAIDQQPVTNLKQFQAAVEKGDLKKGVIVTLISGNVARFEVLKTE